MAVVHYVTSESLLPNGEKLIRGKLTLGSYAAGGAALNLANYLKDDSVPFVLVDSVSNATNCAFSTMTNVCNAEVITVMCLGGGAVEEPQTMLNAGFELTAQNCGFMAIGKAY